MLIRRPRPRLGEGAGRRPAAGTKIYSLSRRGALPTLRLIVPSGWDKTVPQSSLWSTRWTDPADKSSVLMTAQSVSAADAYQALDLAMNAARASTRGYLPGARTAITDGGTVVARQDYQTSWPYANRGATWAVSNGSRISLIDFSGESITDQQLETAGRWIELA